MGIARPINAGANFVSAELGDIGQINLCQPNKANDGEGRLYLNALLGLNGSEISISELPPHTSVPFCSKARNYDEIYIFLKGEGEFKVDNTMFRVETGSVVRVLPQGARCWRNVSDEPLICLILKSRAGGSALGSETQQDTMRGEPSNWQKKSA